MTPLILIASRGNTKPMDILNHILEVNGNEKITPDSSSPPAGSEEYPTYECTIKTKYYENTIAFLPFDGDDMDTLPKETLNRIEALIVYFEPQNKTFLKHLSNLCNFIDSNKIDLGILLTHRLSEDAATGLTYEEVKTASNFRFDVIELSSEDDHDKECSNGKPQGYVEVLEALQNFVWSNVDYPKSSAASQSEESNSDMMESQLEAFEALLNDINNFKRISSTLDRDQVLDQAEKLAELFASIINEN